LTRELARLGHTVAGCARDHDACLHLAAELPAPHRFDPVDVANDRAVAAWVRAVVEAVGVPDLVVNNAALINRSAPLWELTAEEFDVVVDVNVKGVANMARHVLPHMVAQGRGTIVNFSSGWGRSTSPEVAPYCATKWAVEGLTQALAQELPPGLAAVAVNPGIIHTRMLESCFGASAASYQAPASWARRAAPFLLRLGRAHNGQSLDVPD
jgi:NAD(P)-dependent dehydrogenase (short-subunit alcohol dehydrogenase family)